MKVGGLFCVDGIGRLLELRMKFGFIELFQIIVCTIVGTGVLLNFGMLAPGKH